MPIAAIMTGAILVILGFRGTEHQFAKQLGTDVVQGQFLSWALSIAVLGALGYVPGLEKLSRLMLALVVVVLVIHHGGLFANLQQLVQNPPTPTPAIPISAYPAPPPTVVSDGSSSSSSGSSGVGTALAVVGAIAAL